MQKSVMGDQQTVGCSVNKKKFVWAGPHSLVKGSAYQGCSVIYVTQLSYFAKILSVGSSAPTPVLAAILATIPAIHHQGTWGCP